MIVQSDATPYKFILTRLARFTVAGNLAALLITTSMSANAGITSAHARSMVVRRGVVYYVAGQEQKPVDPTERGSKGKPAEPKPMEPKPGRGGNASGSGRTSSPVVRYMLYDVTFTTDVPDAEIMQVFSGASRKPLGRTDTEGNLKVKLPRGKYTVTASRQGLPYQRQQIEVNPNSTKFSFKLAPPKPKETEVKADEASASTASETERGKPASPSSPSMENVSNRYLNVAQTDSVTVSDWDQALKQATAAQDKEPEKTSHRADVLFAQGQIAYLRGNYADALGHFNRAQIAQPDQAIIYYGLGNTYLATKQPREAVKAYQQAVKLNSEMALAYKGMGDALAQLGKRTDAKKFYDKANSLGGASATSATASSAASSTAPDNNKLNLSKASDLMKRGRWADALKELQEISRTHQVADVYIAIGDSYVGLKQPLSAAPAYRKAMELDPQSAIAFYRYGLLTFESREYASAVEALERALALDLTGASINRKRARDLADRARERMRKMQ